MTPFITLALPIHIQPLNKRSSTFASSLATVASFAKSNIKNHQRLVKIANVNYQVVGAVPQSVPVRVAYELLQAGHHFLDIRTVDEFCAGHAIGATNIPYMLKLGSGMMKNPNFLDDVSLVFRKEDEIIIGCQSGRKSLIAAAELAYVGFTGVTDIAGGYSAWLHIGLPTKQ